MWGRQPCSPRRNYQSLPSSKYSATLPKLFLHPSTNPNFSGNQFPNSTSSSIHRAFQFSCSNPPSPTIHSPRISATPDFNYGPIEYSHQNYKFPLPNNHSTKHKDINLNMYQTKSVDELSFEGGKSYAASYIYFNYRHFLTSIEEKEIRNYTEIFYLRRNPKKKKLNNKKNKRSFKNKSDSPNQPNNEQICCESSKNDANEIYCTIKSKINEDLSNTIKLDEASKNFVPNIQDSSNEEFPIGDHIAYRYEILSKIGYGAFGIVLKCYDHKMLHEVALKMIKDTHENHPEIVLEAKFLENLQDGCKQHHIIEFYESFTFRNYFCISMEFIDSNFESQNDQQIRCRLSNSDLLQLFDAVHFIHSNGILHCDIKPSNILFEIDNKSSISNKPNSAGQMRSKDDSYSIIQTNFNSSNNVKNKRRNLSLNKISDNMANNRNFTLHSHKKSIRLIDFGCSCYIGKCPYVKIQSLNYRSPEVILRLVPYTESIDIWSIGCVIYEAAVGIPLFNSNSERELIKEIVELIGKPPAWMIEESPRASKFFIKIGGELKINTKLNQSSNNDNDDLIKNNHDKKSIRSINSTQSSNASTYVEDDLIKNCGDFVNKSLDSIDNNEINFKICLPSSKNTTVRKNRIGKNIAKSSPLKTRVSSVGNPLLLSLLEGCLVWDPHKRLNAEQLLNHPWSRNVK